MVPLLRRDKDTAVIAAIPEEKVWPDSPPSRDAIFSTRAAWVGVFGIMRA